MIQYKTAVLVAAMTMKMGAIAKLQLKMQI
jgi:hypothetical protein